MSREVLAVRLAHRFVNGGLLDRALTHRSAGGAHNERLEFLGDAVLNFLVADVLYRRFPQAREGELTRLRARLVRAPTLAALGRSLNLGADLRLGGGELKSGGRERDSILADALEAVIGAVYLDGGLEPCRQLVHELYRDLLDDLRPETAAKDPKTRLQEWLQARRMPLPVYAVEGVAGEAHEQWFTVACSVTGFDVLARGEGPSRRAAEQAAAEGLLGRLGGSGAALERRAAPAHGAHASGPRPRPASD